MRVLRDVVLTLLVLVILGGLAAYLFARSGGLSARRQPGTLEYAIATRLRNISAAAQAGDVANPLAGQPDAWRAATLHYAGRCAMCHNVNGKGATVIASNVIPASRFATVPIPRVCVTKLTTRGRNAAARAHEWIRPNEYAVMGLRCFSK